MTHGYFSSKTPDQTGLETEAAKLVLQVREGADMMRMLLPSLPQNDSYYDQFGPVVRLLTEDYEEKFGVPFSGTFRTSPEQYLLDLMMYNDAADKRVLAAATEAIK